MNIISVHKGNKFQDDLEKRVFKDEQSCLNKIIQPILYPFSKLYLMFKMFLFASAGVPTTFLATESRSGHSYDCVDYIRIQY